MDYRACITIKTMSRAWSPCYLEFPFHAQDFCGQKYTGKPQAHSVTILKLTSAENVLIFFDHCNWYNGSKYSL